MKSKIILTATLMVVSFAGLCQNGNGNGNENGNSYKAKDKGKEKDTTLVVEKRAYLIATQLRTDKLDVPNPNAADLGRFSAAQVGLFTGSVQYSIPIYEFKTNNLSVPITLEYSSNGLVVDKIASLVGYDWTLSAGGVINRYKKGSKADVPGNRPTYPTNWGSMTSEAKHDYLSSNLYNRPGTNPSGNDLEPDEFTFSFLNYNGKFVFDETGQVRQIPYSDLKIEPIYSAGNTQSYQQFKITTPEGISYFFGLNGYTYPTNGSVGSYPSSYYLTQIQHPNGDIINFSYTKISFFKQSLGVFQSVSVKIPNSEYVGLLPPANVDNSTIDVNYFTSDVCYLDAIESPNVGSVVFEKTRTRADSWDSGTYSNDYELRRIKIVDKTGQNLKCFELFHNYQISNQFPIDYRLSILGDNQKSYLKRMFLDSLQIQTGAATPARISSYKFEYNKLNELPPRFSFAQDHWGFFNGKSNSDFAVKSQATGVDVNNFVRSEANRAPDYLYAQKGMLNKIVFPTRGYTLIEYEPQADPTQPSSVVGGCRVSRTLSYSSGSEEPNIIYYKYYTPQINTYIKYYTRNKIYRYYDVPTPTPIKLCGFDSFYDIGVLSSNSFTNLMINGLYHIIYRKVELWNGENASNGREVNTFRISNDIQSYDVLKRFDNYDDCFIYPNIINNSGWKAVLPEIKSIYDNNSNLIEETMHNYVEDSRKSKIIQCLAYDVFNDYGTSSPQYFGPQICQATSVLSGYDPAIEYCKLMSYKIKSLWVYEDIETTTKNYPNNYSIVTTRNFSYNDNRLLSCETITNSNNKSVETKIKYPSDFTTGVYPSMVTPLTCSITPSKKPLW